MLRSYRFFPKSHGACFACLCICLLLVAFPATLKAFDVKAYTPGDGKVEEACLMPLVDKAENRDNIFYGEQYSFATEIESGANVWFQFGFSNLGTSRGRAILQADFAPPGKKNIRYKKSWSRGDWSFDSGPFSLTFGPNTLKFDGKIWTVHIEADDFVADYTLENLVDPWKPGSGLVDFGSAGYYKINVVAPRARISGRVKMKDGEEHEVLGIAYGDHSATNMAPQKQAQRWMRVRRISKGNNIMLHALQTPEEFGSRWVSWLFVATNNGMAATLLNPQLSFADIETDPATGYTNPGSVLLTSTDFAGAVKVTKRTSREDQLAGLSRAERIIVSKFIKPISFKSNVALEFAWEGKKPLKTRARMYYDQMF